MVYEATHGDGRRRCADGEVAMRGPKPQPIVLPDAARTALEQLARRHTTPQQVALRARIVLAAAEGHNNAQIGRELAISLDMARLWRRAGSPCRR